MTYIATAALLLILATLITIGGVIFTPFLLGLFLLALLGVLARHSDGTVRPRETPTDPTGWRTKQ
jgi:hypothetical protein